MVCCRRKVGFGAACLKPGRVEWVESVLKLLSRTAEDHSTRLASLLSQGSAVHGLDTAVQSSCVLLASALLLSLSTISDR